MRTCILPPNMCTNPPPLDLTFTSFMSALPESAMCVCVCVCVCVFPCVCLTVRAVWLQISGFPLPPSPILTLLYFQTPSLYNNWKSVNLARKARQGRICWFLPEALLQSCLPCVSLTRRDKWVVLHEPGETRTRANEAWETTLAAETQSSPKCCLSVFPLKH